MSIHQIAFSVVGVIWAIGILLTIFSGRSTHGTSGGFWLVFVWMIMAGTLVLGLIGWALSFLLGGFAYLAMLVAGILLLMWALAH